MNTARATRLETIGPHIRQIESSAAGAGETLGQYLNCILEISDTAVRESLIGECFERLLNCPREERRWWMRTIEGLIDGRPQAEKDRLDAERMARALR